VNGRSAARSPVLIDQNAAEADCAARRGPREPFDVQVFRIGSTVCQNVPKAHTSERGESSVLPIEAASGWPSDNSQRFDIQRSIVRARVRVRLCAARTCDRFSEEGKREVSVALAGRNAFLGLAEMRIFVWRHCVSLDGKEAFASLISQHQLLPR